MRFTFIAIRANSADDKLMTLLTFPNKQVLTFHANWRRFVRNAKTYFDFWKNKKNVSNCRLLNRLPITLCVKS